MTFSRLVDVKFKSGRRDEGINKIGDFNKGVREGFEGMLFLFPMNDPDKATYVTLWNSEEAMNDSWNQINSRLMESLGELLEGPPEMRSNEVREIQRLTIPA